ncbi:MAG: helix-turn-helix domain-containing protein [Acidimicrobiia bacterium]
MLVGCVRHRGEGRCGICRLHEREEISRSVARGESLRVIASGLGRAHFCC